MTLIDAPSQLKSTQLCKQNVATSVIRGEGAHARAEEGRREDATDNGDLGRPLQLWACRVREIGTPWASSQSPSLCSGSNQPGLPGCCYK